MQKQLYSPTALTLPILNKKALAAFFFVFTLGLGSTLGAKWWEREQLKGPKAPPVTKAENWFQEPQTVESSLPESLNLDLPFYTQAPFSNWDYPWQEACEEASVLLVANHFKNLQLSREDFNTELLRLVDWQNQVFGSYEHTTVAQTAQMMEENYGLKTQIHLKPSFEDLQNILAQGHLIIAPFDGKALNNPNFRNGGPRYHMLVIKGYDAAKNQVVTHDVGTRNGENYVYSWDTISTALHDWHDEDMSLGTASFIEVYP